MTLVIRSKIESLKWILNLNWNSVWINWSEKTYKKQFISINNRTTLRTTNYMNVEYDDEMRCWISSSPSSLSEVMHWIINWLINNNLIEMNTDISYETKRGIKRKRATINMYVHIVKTPTSDAFWIYCIFAFVLLQYYCTSNNYQAAFVRLCQCHATTNPRW